MTYTFIDLFCGIGGFHQALKHINKKNECVFACDINKECRKVYKKNYGLEPHSDIKKVKLEEIPDFDILCAGFPCQSFSNAGKKLGKKDKRGFQIGDQVNVSKLDSLLYDDHGYPFPEGTTINIDIKRGDEHMEIEHTLEYKNQKYKHRLLREKDPTKTQLKYYSLWKAN